MKRPKFLTIWLAIMLLLSVALALDSLTYLPMIKLTKNYISLLGIAAAIVQVFSLIQLLRWRKRGAMLLVASAIVIMVVTAFNEFSIISNLSQIIARMVMVLVINIIILGVLYLAIKPLWKQFK